MKNHGVDHPYKCREIYERGRETFRKKYKVKYPLQSEELKEKFKDTKLYNYRIKHYKEFLNMVNISNLELLTPYEEHLTARTIKYKCKECGLIFESYYKAVNTITHTKLHCPHCVNKNIIVDEYNISNFISSLIGEESIIKNSYSILDSKKQLDIYIPSKNLAIEFNGIYWHSTERKPKNYHIEKTLKCKEKGIRLIHIFENDWRNNEEICKSIISSALGIYKETIYARKCEVKKLNMKNIKIF